MEIESQSRLHWFQIAEDTDAVAIGFTLRGRGVLELGDIHLSLPPSISPGLAGPQLLDALLEARFPTFPLRWAPIGHIPRVDSHGLLQLGDGEVDLHPPIDWTPFIHQGRTWQLGLHGFAFVNDIYSRDTASPSVTSRWLGELLLDWGHSHPPRPHSTTDLAWNDMAVSYRVLALLRVLEQLRFAAYPDYRSLEQLVDMLIGHTSWLANERNYAPGHDHALFSASSLAYSARVLRHHARAKLWQSRAETLFDETAASLIDGREGTFLEHSPAYDEAVADLIRQRRSDGLPDSLATDIVEELDENLAWLTTPDDRLAPLGDTPSDRRSSRSRPRGTVARPRTGWAAIQTSSASVILTASHHSQAHKHRDDLSVLWHEEGRPVLIEAGHPGYETDSDHREYGTSAWAHNGLVVAGSELELGEPYGSGIVGATEAGEWRLLGGSIPDSSGRQTRYVLYRSRLLIVVDLPELSESGGTTRLFHLAPDIIPEMADGGVRLRVGQKVPGYLIGTIGNETTSFEIVSDEPRYDNRHYPSFGEVAHHHVIRLNDDGPGPRLAAVSWGDDGSSVEIRAAMGGNDSEVHLVIDGQKVTLGMRDGQLRLMTES